MLKLSTLLCSLALAVGLSAPLCALDTPPVAAVVTPAAGSSLNSLPLLSGTAADDAAVQDVQLAIIRQSDGYYWDGAAFISSEIWLAAVFADPDWTYTTPPTWADGETYSVVAKAMDDASNWSVDYSTALFTYDVTAPVVAITTPGSGTYASFPGIAGTAADAYGVAQVEASLVRGSDGLYWNGSAWAAGPLWNAATGSTTWNYAGITSAALDSGTTYFFSIHARDIAGNISGPAPVVSTFTYVVPPVDSQAPTTAVLQPADGSVLSSLAGLAGTDADNVAVSSVVVSVFDPAAGKYWGGSAWDSVPAVWFDASLWTSSWTYTAVPAWADGSSYTVVSKAMDASSNWSVVYSTAHFAYDVTAPVVAITTPVSGTYASFASVSGTADDANGVAQVQVSVRRQSDLQYWNGSAWAAGPLWNNSTGTVAWNYAGITAAGLDSGTTYLFSIRAQDLAGNLSGPASVVSTFTYVVPPADAQPPTVAVLQPVNNAFLNALPDLFGTAADNAAVSTVAVSILRNDTGLYWNGGSWAAGQAWLGASLWPSSWTYTSVPAWVEGSSYTVTSRAMDTSANWAVVYGTAVFTYDITAPVVAITTPVSGTYASFASVSGTADDANGVAQVQVSVRRQSDLQYWNGSAWAAGPLWNMAAGTTAWNYAGITSAALDSGTTYFFTPRAYDAAGNVSGPAPAVSTFTYVLPPVSALSPALFSGVGISSLAVNWGTTFSTGTVYYVRLSSWAAESPYLSAASTAAASLPFSGLDPDTTYYGFVSTMPAAGFIASGSGITRAEPPSGVDFSSVAYTSATLIWSGGANPAWTFYEYEISASSTFAVLTSSSSGAVTSAVFTGLEQWTQYYGRVRAVNGAGLRTGYAEALSSALTLALMPSGLVGGLAGSAQGASSITWTWNSGTVSDADKFSFYSGSSVFLGTAPFGASGSYTQTGLAANAPYKLRVRGRNVLGEGPLTDSATVYTLAAAPAAPIFSGEGYSGAALNWAGGVNPAWTIYEYAISESAGFGVLTSSGSGAVTGVVFTGLSQGATYYGRVRAVNADGAPTAYVYAAAPAITLVLLPSGLVSGLSGAALGVSSIAWGWGSGSVSDADRYALYTGQGVLLATAPFAASGSYAQAGLGPNSAHMLRVAGGNEKGEGQLAGSATVYTLAQIPADPAAPQVALSSAAITLGLNGNPAGTVLQLWRSADNVSFTNPYEGAVLSYADPSLSECSPYYYKARARNGDGLYSGFSGTLSFTTMASTPAAPGGLNAEAQDGARITLAWEPSPSAAVSAYGVYYDSASGSVDYSAPLAVLSSTVTSWTTQALASGSTYKFAVRASGACGTQEKNTTMLASAQAVGLLSGVRAAIKVPQSGKRIKGNMVTVVAEVILGLPSQVAKVRFQYSPAGTGAWADIPAASVNQPNPDLTAPYFVHLNADALTAGIYDLRAVATDIYGTPDAAAPSVTVVICAADYDISESLTAGEQSKEQKINNSVTSTVQAADDATALVTKVVIPSGAVTDSTASLTLVNNPASIPAPPLGADSLSLAVKVNLSNGQSQLAAGRTAALSFSYKDDDGNGIVDGTLAAVDRLRVYSVSDSGGAWAQLDTSVDKEKKTVSAVTTHFSFFSVFATAASGLGSVKLYPVPWQPGAGGRFDSAKGVTFSGLPAAAKISIFTINGELVRLLEVSAIDAGFKIWDGCNSQGHKAASGIYLAVVKAGSDVRTIKVAVER